MAAAGSAASTPRDSATSADFFRAGGRRGARRGRFIHKNRAMRLARCGSARDTRVRAQKRPVPSDGSPRGRRKRATSWHSDRNE